MLRLLSVVASSAVFSFGFLALSAGDARADDAHPAPAAAAAAKSAEGEKPQAKDDADDVKHISLELNPLGFAIGRYSIQGEYVLTQHHAVTLNPYYQHTSLSSKVSTPTGSTTLDGGSISGFGGELGYRFYTGSKGANGFFVGPSFLFGAYSADSGIANAPTASITSIGGALDVGGQFIIGPGVVLGFGAGLQYTSTSKDVNPDNLAASAVVGGGVRPRFLLAVGYSF